MPRKKTRRRQRTPRPTVWQYDPPDELDELLAALAIEDELDMLPDDVPGPRAHPQQRPLGMSRADLVRSPLSEAWAVRAGDCGAGAARLARGLDYLLSGALLDLQVSRGRLAAVVRGNRRYRVVVDVLLPPRADMQAALERVQAVRAAPPPGTEARLAVQQAIVAGGSHLFPSRSQLGPQCPCPDGAPCKHVVAAVLGFGVLLSREPELLFTLWGFPADEVRATPTFVLPPLPADRQPLVGDLGAIFGIDLFELAPLSEDPTPLDTAVSQGDSPAVAAREPEPAAAKPADELIAREPAAPVPPPAVSPPSEQSEVGRDHLRILGLSTRTIDAWLRTGVLRPTDRKDIYERTPAANRKIASFLAR